MDQRKTKAFSEGRDIHAYNIFGAHLEANGVRLECMLQTQRIFQLLVHLIIGMIKRVK